METVTINKSEYDELLRLVAEYQASKVEYDEPGLETEVDDFVDKVVGK